MVQLMGSLNEIRSTFEDGLRITLKRSVRAELRQAFNYFQEASKAGHLNAGYIVGLAYLKGTGVAKSQEKAMQYLVKSASQHHLDSILALASIYVAESKIDEAIFQYLKAIELGATFAITQIKALLDTPLGVTFFDRLIEQELKDEIQSDDIQLAIGHFYFYGLGESNDINTAQSWYRKAARNNNPFAFYALGNIDLSGILGNPDYLSAIDHYNNAAELGFSKGYLAIAMIHANENIRLNGNSRDTQMKEAFKFYKKAADMGDSTAIGDLAILHIHGIELGFPNYEEAYNLLSIASDKGNLDAMLNLANCLASGFGTAIDYERAQLYYMYLSNQTGEISTIANYGLGMVRIKGFKDTTGGKVYLEKAAKNGSDEAKQALLNLKG